MHFNQGQSEVQCSGELENTSTKWSQAEALQKQLEDCKGSLCISQQHDRTRNDQMDFKRNRFIFDQVSNDNEIQALGEATSGDQTGSFKGKAG